MWLQVVNCHKKLGRLGKQRDHMTSERHHEELSLGAEHEGSDWCLAMSWSNWEVLGLKRTARQRNREAGLEGSIYDGHENKEAGLPRYGSRDMMGNAVLRSW
jgi:hypothetical protein